MDSITLQQKQEQLLIQPYDKCEETTKRILIVNYEDDVNFTLKLVLEEEGGRIIEQAYKRNCYQVDSFNDPILALNNFENGYYDLLLIGVVMHKLNGFELAKEIRKIDDKVKICFLIAGEIPSKVRFDGAPLSYGQQEETLYQDKYIKLPIENKELIEQIDRIVIHS